MSDLAFYAVTAGFMIGSVVALIVLAVVMKRRTEKQIAAMEERWNQRQRASLISADEVIDVHLALQELKSLREISEHVAA